MQRFYAGLSLILILLGMLIGVACKDQSKERREWPEVKTCSKPPPWGKEEKEKIRRIRNFFQKKHRHRLFNGTVLFAEKGRVLFEKAYGYRSRHKGDTLQVNDPFQLASVSKPLTATLILKLWEKGKLDLEDSLSHYFDAWPYDKRITIRMLLTHRSGLPNYMYFMDGWKKGENYYNEDVLNRIQKDTPNVYYIPDHRYNYCNTNYCLLALIAERAADTSYRAALKESIYRPVGMDAPDSLLSLKPEKNKVKGHNKWGTPIEEYPNRAKGDKGLYADARDLYRFDRALRKRKLLEDSTLKAAYTPQHKDLYQHDNYGLGWRIDQKNPDDRIIWHNGWWKGFRTYFIRLLERDATIIVLNNTTRGPFFNKRKLIQLLFPDRKSTS